MDTITITQGTITGIYPRYEKHVYYLPEREVTMPDGRIATATPGGFSSKSETLSLVRRLHPQRPLNVQWPNGTTTVVKR